MLVLDLCSGVGGAAAAFDKEDVISVDIERGFKPSIVADVENLPFRTNLSPDLVIFCPPCQCFSIMAVFHYWNHGEPGSKAKRAIQLVENGLKELHRLNPKYWIMENPMGMLRTVIGKPRHTIRMSDYGAQWKKPTDLWGNVPFKMLTRTRSWIRSPRGSHVGVSSNKYRAAERAKWPLGLSQAVKEAVER